MEKYIAFIPVRGGSKSIPLKNIRPFCGRPLVYWTAKAASDCAAIGHVYVATDDARIADVVRGLMLPRVEVVARGAETATDTASTESAMREFARAHDFENIVLVQATSPLLTADDLAGGIAAFEAGGYDSLLSVVRQKRFVWREADGGASPVNYDPQLRPRRQEMTGFFVENGAFYLTSRVRLLETASRLSGRIGVYEMPEATYFEIDEPSDWVIMEHLKRQASGCGTDKISEERHDEK